MLKSFLLYTVFLLLTISLFSQSDYRNHLALAAEADYFESQEYMIGKPIFEFSAKTIDGEQLNSADLKGKVLVINLWFMACPPCLSEMKGLNEIVEKHEDNDQIAFVYFTRDSEADLTRDFFPNHDFKFEIVADADDFIMGDFAHRWGFPTTFVVDKYGLIQKIVSGGSTEEEVAEEQIQEELLPIIEDCLKQ